jgi:HK97 family phage portal protein
MASARQLLARGLRTLVRAVEGEYRPGPYNLPITGGWLPDGSPSNWWQMGMDPIPLGSQSAIVEACVSAYSQTMAMCPGDHWRATSKGGRERVKNSALSRILRMPNAYQTSSDFLLNSIRQLYLDGNAYALALRNDRYEISELHLMDSRLCKPMVVTQTGDVFYRLGGNAVIQNELLDEYPLLVPLRDVLHIRMHADRRYPFPLWGQTPLLAAVSDMMVTDAIASQQIQFYLNQARPAAVLSTDLDLDHDQVQALQDRWDERSKGIAQGKTPVLTHGLKVQPWSVGGRDAQLAELLKFSKENIALVFRVPLAVLGLGGATFGSTEALMQFWISTGLGFALNHVEQAFDRLFQLKGQPDEYTELSTDPLLRSAMKDRIEALKEGVMGGIFSPNEARNREDLDSVPFGDSPRVQQQVVPLEAAAGIVPGAGGATGPHPPPAPPAAGQPPAAAIDLKPSPSQKVHDDDVKRAIRGIHDAAARINRRFT